MPDFPKPVGVYAPTVTAFNADESLNQRGTRAFVRFLLDAAIHGLICYRSGRRSIMEIPAEEVRHEHFRRIATGTEREVQYQ